MTNDEFHARRTELSNTFAAAGAELLDYMGCAGALAAIPSTQQYVVAGSVAAIRAQLDTVEPQRRMRHGDRPGLPLYFGAQPGQEVLEVMEILPGAPAIANKATEEGEQLHHAAIAAAEEWANAEWAHAKNLGAGGPGSAERCNKAEIACRTAINELAAERASRQVANKAEVEPVAWMRDNLKECTTTESKKKMENAGFGVWHEVAASYTIPLYATPPATTGASTVLTDERMRTLYEAWEMAEAERRKGEPLDNDERAYVVKRCPGASDTYNIAPAAWPAFKAGCEVAAQAGQVAVPGWQPIETVPGDMSSRLYLVEGFCLQGFVDAAGDLMVQSEVSPHWRKMRGKPTHWMPLSPSPAKESK